MELIAQAFDLKRAQLEQDRAVWNTWPSFVQSTLFHDAEVTADRFMVADACATADVAAFVAALKRALDASLTMRAAGEKAIAEGRYADATCRFEESAGVFTFVMPLREEWRRSGLRDHDLRLIRFDCDAIRRVAVAAFGEAAYYASPDIQPLLIRIRQHLAAVYTAIAETAAQQGQWDLCTLAARYVLKEVDPAYANAAYLAAKGLVSTPTSSAAHLDQAIDLLRVVVEAEPSAANRANGRGDDTQRCAELLTMLTSERSRRRKQEQEMFGGMFGRRGWGGEAGIVDTPVRVPADPIAQRDADSFPAQAASAPIFRDVQKGWAAITALRDSARSASLDSEAEHFQEKAAAIEEELVDICAQKIFREALVPAMATSPSLLRCDVDRGPDRLLMGESSALGYGRSCVRMFGFDTGLWNAVCASGGGASTKETLLYDRLAGMCREAFVSTAVSHMKPMDVACYIISSSGAPITGDDVKVGDAASTGRLRAWLSSIRDKNWSIY